MPRDVEPDVEIGQYGRFEMLLRQENKGDLRHNLTLEVHDVRQDKLLWTRAFPYRPPYSFFSRDTGSLVLAWPLADDASRKALGSDPGWQQRVQERRDEQGLAAVEVLEPPPARSAPACCSIPARGRGCR